MAAEPTPELLLHGCKNGTLGGSDSKRHSGKEIVT
jgi:hypothetical protein